jgi:hypothetical protein
MLVATPVSLTLTKKSSHMYQFKSQKEFDNKSYRICYIPENADPNDRDEHYNYHDFLRVCKNNQELAEIVFDLCKWQSPETVILEMLHEGEIDKDYNIIPQE